MLRILSKSKTFSNMPPSPARRPSGAPIPSQPVANEKLTGLETSLKVLSGLSRHLHQIVHSVIAEVLEADDLKPLEFGLLVLALEWPGIDQNTVAAKMAIDRTSVSAMVDRLEKRKLLKRAVHAEDRRARSLQLTDAGKALCARLRPQSRAAQRGVLATLSVSERELFVALLVRVVEANEIHARPGVGRRKPTPRKE
jgi:DNA-binding MarR family transcriptional regulator